MIDAPQIQHFSDKRNREYAMNVRVKDTNWRSRSFATCIGWSPWFHLNRVFQIIDWILDRIETRHVKFTGDEHGPRNERGVTSWLYCHTETLPHAPKRAKSSRRLLTSVIHPECGAKSASLLFACTLSLLQLLSHANSCEASTEWFCFVLADTMW